MKPINEGAGFIEFAAHLKALQLSFNEVDKLRDKWLKDDGNKDKYKAILMEMERYQKLIVRLSRNAAEYEKLLYSIIEVKNRGN